MEMAAELFSPQRRRVWQWKFRVALWTLASH